MAHDSFRRRVDPLAAGSALRLLWAAVIGVFLWIAVWWALA
jgi:hypothetical protein